MGVGIIGYLILHLNDYPSILKSSWTLTLYCVKAARCLHPGDLYIDLMKLVTYAGEQADISIALYATNYC